MMDDLAEVCDVLIQIPPAKNSISMQKVVLDIACACGCMSRLLTCTNTSNSS